MSYEIDQPRESFPVSTDVVAAAVIAKYGSVNLG
jgi:hypothetical protein